MVYSSNAFSVHTIDGFLIDAPLEDTYASMQHALNTAEIHRSHHMDQLQAAPPNDRFCFCHRFLAGPLRAFRRK